MDKKDWRLLEEFETLMDLERLGIILRHKTCEASISINLIPTPAVLTLKDIVNYAIQHKKNDCKRLQGLKASITIFDEVDHG